MASVRVDSDVWLLLRQGLSLRVRRLLYWRVPDQRVLLELLAMDSFDYLRLHHLLLAHIISPGVYVVLVVRLLLLLVVEDGRELLLAVVGEIVLHLIHVLLVQLQALDRSREVYF